MNNDTMPLRQLPYSRACAFPQLHGTTSLVLTMKRAIQAILIAAFILTFGLFIYFFAKLRQENLDASLPVAGRIADLSTTEGLPGSAGGENRASQRSKINPEWGETFLDAIDMNLDEDEDLEQVLIVKTICHREWQDRPRSRRLSARHRKLFQALEGRNARD